MVFWILLTFVILSAFIFACLTPVLMTMEDELIKPNVISNPELLKIKTQEKNNSEMIIYSLQLTVGFIIGCLSIYIFWRFIKYPENSKFFKSQYGNGNNNLVEIIVVVCIALYGFLLGIVSAIKLSKNRKKHNVLTD